MTAVPKKPAEPAKAEPHKPGKTPAHLRVLRSEQAKAAQLMHFGAHSHAEDPPKPESFQTPTWASQAGNHARAWNPGEEVPATPASSTTHASAPQENDGALQDAATQLERVYEETYEEARQAGFEQGEKEGRKEGRKEGKQQMEASQKQLAETIARFEEQLKSLQNIRRRAMIDAEEQTVELALTIAQRLAGEALLCDTSWVAPLMREAIEALTDADRIACRVAPSLAKRIEEASVVLPPNTSVVIDQDLQELGMVFESQFGRVDASFQERFEHMRRAVEDGVASVQEAPDTDEKREAKPSPPSTAQPQPDEPTS